MANQIDSKVKEMCRNIIREVGSSVENFEGEILSEIQNCLKSLNNLIEQLVAVSSVSIDKNFFGDMPFNAKERISAKIQVCIDQQMSKLLNIQNEFGMKINKLQSTLALLDGFDSPTTGKYDDRLISVNLSNIYELTRDCVNISAVFFANLQIAVADVDYKTVDSLKSLESVVEDGKNLKKSICEKTKIVQEVLNTSLPVEINVKTIPKSTSDRENVLER